MKKNLLSKVLIFTFLAACCYVGVNQYSFTEHRDLTISEKRADFKKFIDQHPYSNRDLEVDLKSLPKKDRPDLAMEQNFLSIMDPNTLTVPYERIVPAFEYTKRMFQSKGGVNPSFNPLKGKGNTIQQRQDDGNDAISVGGNDVVWEERGPDNVGGRTRAFLWDPNDPTNRRVFTGGTTGGLWVNDNVLDANSSWRAIDEFLGGLGITTLTSDPTNTMNFYAGTGEGWFGSGFIRGVGVFQSLDGGETWDVLPSTSGEEFAFVQKVAVTPTGTLLVATRAASSGFGVSNGNGGIFRSDDNGASFTRVLIGVGADIEVAANGDIYASRGIFTPGTIFKSTDDGLNWSDVTPPPTSGTNSHRIEIATAPSDADILYAMSHDRNDDEIGWVQKSDDAGVTWTNLTIPTTTDGCRGVDDLTRNQAWYDLILAVNPVNPDVVVAGGIDLGRTEDGGQTWTQISEWTNCSGIEDVHADHHSIVFRPNNPNEALFGHDGGVSYSPNVGAAFTPTFENRNKNYSVTQFYAVATDNVAGSDYYIAGAQDNGTQQLRADLGASAFEIIGGDGAFAHVDQLDRDFQIGSTQNGNARHSFDGGGSFSALTVIAGGNFINQTDYDNTAGILYSTAGDDQIGRNDNLKSSSPAAAVALSFDFGGEQSSAILANTNTANRIFVGTEGGEIFRIDDANIAAPTVTNITNNITALGTVSSIDVGSSDMELIATYSNFGVVSVWYTTDGGANWISKDDAGFGLPDMPIRWALFNPNNTEQVLLATELGVWSTNDITAANPGWEPSNEGLANVRCDMIQYREADGHIVVATHGRGLYTSNIFEATGDTDGPIATGFTPEDDEAAALPLDANLEIQFDESVRVGAGNVVIRLTSDDSPIETISVASSQINTTGTRAIINPSADLLSLTDYYIEVDAGAFTDNFDNPFAGIAGNTTWNFTTFDGDVAPVVNVPITDINVDENSSDVVVDLANVFNDVDSDNSLITFAINDNSNSLTVSTAISGSDLTLSFAADKIGIAQITLRATSNGKTVDDVFNVTVNSTSAALFAQASGAPTNGQAEGVYTDVTFQNADDFRVPAGQNWEISTVTTQAFFLGGLDLNLESVDVIIFNDDSGAPGTVAEQQTVLVDQGQIIGGLSNNPSLTVRLNSIITLAPGTYWMSILPTFDVNAQPFGGANSALYAWFQSAAAGNSFQADGTGIFESVGSEMLFTVDGTIAYIGLTPITSFPYTEDFEGGTTPDGWTSDGDLTWFIQRSGTSSGATGPLVDNTLGTAVGYFAYGETSSPVVNGDEGFLTTRLFDLSVLTGPELEFFYHMHGSGMGTLNVEVLDITNETETLIFTISGEQQAAQADPYLVEILDLSAFRNSVVRLRFTSIKGTSFRSDIAIDDITISGLPNDDLVLSKFLSAAIPQNVAVPLTIEITNAGALSQAGFDIIYQVPGLPLVTETFPGVIAPGEVVNYTSTATFTETAPVGTVINYEVAIDLPTDANPLDNEGIFEVTVFGTTVNTFPYAESFEVDNGDWFSDGQNNSFELGVPASTNINAASDGTQAWVTNLTGDYNNNEESVVISPIFDFTSLADPVILLDTKYVIETSWDGTILQSSIDGTTWQNVGALGDPGNWYNGTSNGSIDFASTSLDIWTGTSDPATAGEYITANHALDGLGEQSSVILRIAFGSDGSAVREGFAFDNVRVVSRSTLLQLTCPTDLDIPSNNAGVCEASVTVTQPTFSNNTGIVTFVNSYNNTDDASDIYPVGTTEVTWTGVDELGTVATCVMTITVHDDEAPTVSSTSDVIVSVRGIERIVDYSVPTVSDNCQVRITQSNTQTLSSGNGVACPTGPNNYLRAFDIASDFIIESLEFGIDDALDPSGSQQATANIYTYNPADPFTYSNFSLIASEVVDIADATLFFLNVPINAVISSGSTVVIELVSPNGGSALRVSGQPLGSTGTSYIAASACGIIEPTDVAAIGFANSQWIMNINGEGITPATLTGGIGSGNVFPLGTTTEFYQGTDASGNSTTTSFDVIVELEPPLPLPASEVGSFSFVANWEAIDGINEYFIDVSDDGFATFITEFEDKLITTNSATMSGAFVPGNTYEYRVRASNGAGIISLNSEVTSVTLQKQFTLTPVQNVSTTSFTLLWETVPDAIFYEVDVATDEAFTNLIFDKEEVAATGATFEVAGLSENTSYYARVRASNGGLFTVYTNTVVGKTFNTGDAPVSIAASDIGLFGFTANWNAVTGVSEYLLDVSSDGFNTFVAGFDGTVLTTTTEVVTGLVPGTNYEYRVRSSSGGLGISTNSNVISVATSDEFTLMAPSNITANSFTLSWDAVEGAIEYRVDIASDDRFLNRVFYNEEVTTTSFEATGLNQNTTYYATVRVTNGVAFSTNAPTVSATTLGVPSAPSSLTADGTSGTGISLSWVDNSDKEVDFVIERSIDAVNFTELTVTAADAVSFLDATAITGIKYSYRVAARNEIRSSEYSNTAATVRLDVPFAPSDLTVDGSLGASIQLRWADNSANEDVFVIERSEDGVSFTEIATTFKNATSFSDATAVDRTAYSYRIAARNALGTSEYSNTAAFLITGIDDELLAQEIHISPNPSDGVYSLSIGSLKANSILIWNPVGQLVMERMLDVKDQDLGLNFELDITEENSGMYLLQINLVNDITVFRKLIKE